MRGFDPTGQRLVAIFLLGGVALHDPVLSLCTRRGDVAGIPLSYAYLFGVWGVLIALMALAVRRPRA
jgi:hypothetical protein